MAGKYQVNKVKHLVCIFEQNNVKSKKEKRSSELTVVSSSAEAVLCDHCLFGKTEQEADGFCKTCLEYLCARCVQEHVKAKLTREHSLIRNNIPKEDAEVLRRMRTMVFCIEHPGQTIAYHCQEHDEYTCYLCKENNHKECKATSLIRSGQSNSDGTSSIFERLYTTRDKVRSLKDVKETRIKSLLQEKHQIQREQHGYFQELSESIAECVKRENSKCEELVGTMVKDITNEVNECEKIEENDICQKEMLEAAIQYCSDDNLALITRMIERKMDTLEGKINCLEQEGSAQIRFCKNDSLLDNLSVGTVTVLHNKSDTSSREQVELASDEVEIAGLEEEIRNDEVEIIQTVDRTYVPHTGVASYVSQRRTGIDCNIRLGDDYHTCSVWGLVVFPDGRLVLIDNANLKMKLFTKKFNFVCAEPVQDHPTSICYLGRDIVAVAFGKSTHIHTYFIGAQSIYPYRTLKTDGFFCRGLAFYRDNAVAAIVSNRDILRTVQADDDVEVHVFYLRTSCTKIIRYFESVEGNDLWFRDPVDLSFAGKNVMLIADSRIVHCFDLIGGKNGEKIAEQRWYYRLADDACHVTNDGKSAFICERRGNVHQVALDNYRYSTKIISNIETPYSLSMDEGRGRIIIGYCENDSIKVFNFRYSKHPDRITIVPWKTVERR